MHRIDEMRARRDLRHRAQAQGREALGVRLVRPPRGAPDIDLLVKFKDGISLFDFVGFQQDAEDAMACPVDAVDVENFGRDPVFAAEHERQLLAVEPDRVRVGQEMMIKTIKMYKDVAPAEDYSWARAMTDSERLACASRLTRDLWRAAHGGSFPAMNRRIVRLVK